MIVVAEERISSGVGRNFPVSSRFTTWSIDLLSNWTIFRRMFKVLLPASKKGGWTIGFVKARQYLMLPTVESHPS